MGLRDMNQVTSVSKLPASSHFINSAFNVLLKR